MANGVNKVTLLGNLGHSPEFKRVSDSFSVATVSLATGESWKDKDTGEKREITEWHRVIFYNKLAEIVDKHVHKGDKIYIEGKLKTRKYTDKQGVEKYTTEIIAHELKMLGGGTQKPKEEENPYTAHSQAQAESQYQQGQFDDDIPF